MTSTNLPLPVIVIIGGGGMGIAIAQRLGSGRKLLLADFSADTLASASARLRSDGHNVDTIRVDIADRVSVSTLAARAASAGSRLEAVVHIAGISPALSSDAKRIYATNLIGTALVIDAFEKVVSAGSAVVCVASMAGHTVSLAMDVERHLATAPPSALLGSTAIDLSADTPFTAYALSKRANILRVRGAAAAYAARGARINSVSPGIIATPMAEKELADPASGRAMREMVARAFAARMGTSQDIAGAVAFLVGPEAAYVTGSDLLVDGGCVARRWAAENEEGGS